MDIITDYFGTIFAIIASNPLLLVLLALLLVPVLIAARPKG